LGTPAVRLFLLSFLFFLFVSASPGVASAEKIIAKGDDWQVFTDGRVGGFVSYVHGDGFPVTTEGTSPTGDQVDIQKPLGGGWVAADSRGKTQGQGTIDSMRVRSGFIGNTLGIGVRGQVTPYTMVTGYIQFWADIESLSRQKSQPNVVDARQGYAKLEGWWGSFLAGRTRTLFSRGATDIDVLYGQRWGIGFPGNIDSNGFGSGHVGFGVMGSGFASGLIYGTPVFKGLQLNVGLFDPVELQGNAFNRTKYGRPEAELTYERALGEQSKLVLFANGAYERLYQSGYCVVDPATNPSCEETAEGVGYGGRIEVGPFHLGVAGFVGKGLGLNYALEQSDASTDIQGTLRKFDGYYVQSQLVLGKFDLSAGWGIVRVFLTDYDNQKVQDPRLPTMTPDEIAANGIILNSVIKYQMGISAGIVYNLTPNVHLDLDFFRAKAAWFLGETQTLYVANTGMVFNW
jgi:hypothetical protein